MTITELIAWMETLTQIERKHVIDAIEENFCIHCGGPAGCYCWNDE